jgi:hypothetical protein
MAATLLVGTSRRLTVSACVQFRTMPRPTVDNDESKAVESGRRARFVDGESSSFGCEAKPFALGSWLSTISLDGRLVAVGGLDRVCGNQSHFGGGMTTR